MDIRDFKKAKWSGDTYIRITNKEIYQGNEKFRVVDVDFRYGTLGIDYCGNYMRVPCEDIEIVGK